MGPEPNEGKLQKISYITLPLPPLTLSSGMLGCAVLINQYDVGGTQVSWPYTALSLSVCLCGPAGVGLFRHRHCRIGLHRAVELAGYFLDIFLTLSRFLPTSVRMRTL